MDEQARTNLQAAVTPQWRQMQTRSRPVPQPGPDVMTGNVLLDPAHG